MNATVAFALSLALQVPPSAAPPVAPPPPSTAPEAPAAPTQPAATSRSPVVFLFHNLAADLARLPSLDSAAILMGGAGIALVVRPTDDNLATWARERGESGYTPFGRVLGDGLIQGGAAIGAYIAGAASGHRATEHIGSDLIRAQALNAVITRVAKLGIGRDRPGGSPDSMPSGHASASFASAAVLGQHFGWKVGAPAYALAGFVGWTRVRDRAHWGTDVVVGATVGSIVGYTITRGHRETRWSVIPAISGRSAAITVVRVR